MCLLSMLVLCHTSVDDVLRVLTKFTPIALPSSAKLLSIATFLVALVCITEATVHENGCMTSLSTAFMVLEAVHLCFFCFIVQTTHVAAPQSPAELVAVAAMVVNLKITTLSYVAFMVSARRVWHDSG